jgi:hypothetical protein
MDMQLLRGSVDVAMLPIGDNFTMGPEDAARAVEMISPDVVIPMHYNTFPLIEQSAEGFRDQVGDLARVEILLPGGTYSFRRACRGKATHGHAESAEKLEPAEGDPSLRALRPLRPLRAMCLAGHLR